MSAANALTTGFLDAFETSASREVLSPAVRDRRLLLCLYALGTNAGLKRVAAGSPEDSYDELLHVHRRFMHPAALRAACARVASATLGARGPVVWGEVGTACASDSTKFGAWDRNLMTEWHVRYGGRGVMIYWHVERRACCVYSQLKRCSSSEVAAMIEGVARATAPTSRSSASTSTAMARASLGSRSATCSASSWRRG